jgi:hypothetical protein
MAIAGELVRRWKTVGGGEAWNWGRAVRRSDGRGFGAVRLERRRERALYLGRLILIGSEVHFGGDGGLSRERVAPLPAHYCRRLGGDGLAPEAGIYFFGRNLMINHATLYCT